MSVVATVAAGCISSRAGTPQAAPGLSSGPVVPPSSTVSRPRQLDLTGVEVCTLLTNQQLANFAVDRPSRPGTAGGGSVLVGSPECQFGSDAEQHGFLILASTSMGLPEFLSKIQPNPSRAVITVNGYPAVQEEGLGELSAPERGSGACFVEVDVADGQLLGVQFSQIAAREPKRLPIETLCAKAREVAEAALTTLQGG
ncbi:MAG TPA: DUF3558 domain-containing protein [Pseudonocardiaceae bacterium]